MIYFFKEESRVLKKVLFFSLIGGLGLAFLFGLPKTGFSAPKFQIKFATVAPEGSIWMKHMRKLDQRIQKKSEGQVKFRFYAGQIAGDEIDVLKKIRIGQIHCTAFSGVGFGKILPMVRVLDLPFLFKNYQEVDMVHRELRAFFSDQFLKKGFELLSWAEVGNAHLFSKQSISRVEDLSKLKVWTWSGDPISKETLTLMGAHPIPLSITDVTTALSTGMVDTVYAVPYAAVALQWHLHLKTMMSLPLAHSTGAILISSKYFKKFPPHLAELIRTEFDQAMPRLTVELRKQSEETIRLIKNRGLEILPMPAGKDLEHFNNIHNMTAQALTGKIFPKRLLEQVNALLTQVRGN